MWLILCLKKRHILCNIGFLPNAPAHTGRRPWLTVESGIRRENGLKPSSEQLSGEWLCQCGRSVQTLFQVEDSWCFAASLALPWGVFCEVWGAVGRKQIDSDPYKLAFRSQWEPPPPKELPNMKHLSVRTIIREKRLGYFELCCHQNSHESGFTITLHWVLFIAFMLTHSMDLSCKWG